MGKSKYQTRLAADDAERVDQYADDRDISQSEAVRRLIRAGLEVETDDGEIVDTRGTATARVNETARQTGGLVLLAVLVLLTAFLVLAEVGIV